MRSSLLSEDRAYLPFVSRDHRVDARLSLVGVARSELDPVWAEAAAPEGETTEESSILACPSVAARYRERKPSELARVDSTTVTFLDPSTWTMECLSFGASDAPFAIYWTHIQLRSLVSSMLAAAGDLLLHGSGFVIDGLAAAVIGPSEAGKTTAARLVNGDRLLSDDMVAVTDVDQQPCLHATPLGRDSDGPGSAPLRAIFFPRKQAAFSLRPLTARDALIRSAREQADTFQSLFQPYGGMAIRNLARLFRKVPAYELGFSLDGIDRDAIRRVLAGF
jgi:hypothetical protein